MFLVCEFVLRRKRATVGGTCTALARGRTARIEAGGNRGPASGATKLEVLKRVRDRKLERVILERLLHPLGDARVIERLRPSRVQIDLREAGNVQRKIYPESKRALSRRRSTSVTQLSSGSVEISIRSQRSVVASALRVTSDHARPGRGQPQLGERLNRTQESSVRSRSTSHTINALDPRESGFLMKRHFSILIHSGGVGN